MIAGKLQILESKKSIFKGSKSFSLASLFLPAQKRYGAWILYRFCRWADDLIDRAENPREALEALSYIREQVTVAFQDRDTPVCDEALGLRFLAKEFQIPEKYPFDLLRGLEMDVVGVDFETIEELEDYCYCVASTVGLMMSHILGVSSQEALAHAVSLGKAMQLTNICRDISEDYVLGRIYFPNAWLQEVSLTREQFGKPVAKEKWVQLASKALDLADAHYRHGRQGFRYLPYWGILAVDIAAEVYRRIGIKVRARGVEAWTNRCYVSLLEKSLVVIKKISFSTVYLFRRIRQPWHAEPIQTVWSSN